MPSNSEDLSLMLLTLAKSLLPSRLCACPREVTESDGGKHRSDIRSPSDVCDTSTKCVFRNNVEATVKPNKKIQTCFAMERIPIFLFRCWWFDIPQVPRMPMGLPPLNKNHAAFVATVCSIGVAGIPSLSLSTAPDQNLQRQNSGESGIWVSRTMVSGKRVHRSTVHNPQPTNCCF